MYFFLSKTATQSCMPKAFLHIDETIIISKRYNSDSSLACFPELPDRFA